MSGQFEEGKLTWPLIIARERDSGLIDSSELWWREHRSLIKHYESGF